MLVNSIETVSLPLLMHEQQHDGAYSIGQPDHLEVTPSTQRTFEAGAARNLTAKHFDDTDEESGVGGEDGSFAPAHVVRTTSRLSILSQAEQQAFSCDENVSFTLAPLTACGILLFMWMHSAKADAHAAIPWIIVISPLLLLALLLLVLLALSQCRSGVRDRLPLTESASLALGALTVISVGIKLCLRSASYSWSVALLPLLTLLAMHCALQVSAVTGAASHGTLTRALRQHCAPLLHLLFCVAASALLTARLSGDNKQPSWWLIGAPWALAQLLTLWRGCVDLLSLGSETAVPLHADDAADWLMRHESSALSRSTSRLLGSLFQLCLTRSLCAQLEATSSTGFSENGSSWGGTYLPYAACLLLLLCCASSCSLCLMCITASKPTTRSNRSFEPWVSAQASASTADSDASSSELATRSLLDSNQSRSDHI